MRSNKRVCNILYRLFFVLGLVVLPFISNAQDQNDPSCGDTDPFQQPCPLDTWVIILVVVAGIFTAVHLHRKQKSLQA
nr:hypothetical protein [Mucilaginibacter sp. FT3.2]